MKGLKSTALVAVLTLTICSAASAGTITGSKAGTITGSKAGTITGSKAGTITGSRAGTITGSRAGTITGSRSEDVSPLQTYRQGIVAYALNALFRLAW